MNYNVTGNGRRECLKIIRIGQSASKPLNWRESMGNVQRLISDVA